FLKHFVFVVIALIIIFFISLQKREIIKAYLPYFFIISLLLLLLVPLIGIEVKGAKRWLDIPLLPRFQPIEILKPFFIVMTASVLSLENYRNIYLKYFFSFLIIVPIIILLITQPDIGQTLLIIVIWFSLIFVSGINLIFFFSFFGLVSIVLSYIILFVPKFDYIQKSLETVDKSFFVRLRDKFKLEVRVAYPFYNDTNWR
ncbi:MAG: FtsW/RodA/SpoVE family cell cycle protein, partial [Candidatus Marinimicrobia bacterium]|nr:FtsW/RodA/SpoVE family cell cycle protein [Candidatus Neomarinimicrobiota bacterium]